MFSVGREGALRMNELRLLRGSWNYDNSNINIFHELFLAVHVKHPYYGYLQGKRTLI